MTTETDALHRFILETFADTGGSPSLGQISERFELNSTSDAEALVTGLEQEGSINRIAGDTHITHAYPFSNELTSHKVLLDTGVEVYSMCAVDALGIPFMLRRDARIASVCSHCHGDVRVAISAKKVESSSPANLVVWFPRVQPGCVPATDLCPEVNFFCSEEHLEAWRQDQPEHQGELLSLGQAVERGRVIFESMLERGGAFQLS